MACREGGERLRRDGRATACVLRSEAGRRDADLLELHNTGMTAMKLIHADVSFDSRAVV